MELPMVAKYPSPNNFLACRESKQVARFQLLRHEEKMFKLFGVNNHPALEEKLLHCGPLMFPMEVKEYQRLHEAFDAADKLFNAACSIQRSRLSEQKQ